jgi:hypothetical protein
MSSSMEAKPSINIVNNVYFFEKISNPISSSMEAKPNINVVNNFLLFREYFKINIIINGGKTKINVVKRNYTIYQIDRKSTQAETDSNGFKGLKSSQGVRIGSRH